MRLKMVNPRSTRLVNGLRYQTAAANDYLNRALPQTLSSRVGMRLFGLRFQTGNAVVYFVVDSAKCEDAPPTAVCSSRTRIKKLS